MICQVGLAFCHLSPGDQPQPAEPQSACLHTTKQMHLLASLLFQSLMVASSICDKSPPPVLILSGFMSNSLGSPQVGLLDLAPGSPHATAIPNTTGLLLIFLAVGLERNSCAYYLPLSTHFQQVDAPVFVFPYPVFCLLS